MGVKYPAGWAVGGTDEERAARARRLRACGVDPWSEHDLLDSLLAETVEDSKRLPRMDVIRDLSRQLATLKAVGDGLGAALRTVAS
jgi:hypothetical protein